MRSVGAGIDRTLQGHTAGTRKGTQEGRTARKRRYAVAQSSSWGTTALVCGEQRGVGRWAGEEKQQTSGGSRENSRTHALTREGSRGRMSASKSACGESGRSLGGHISLGKGQGACVRVRDLMARQQPSAAPPSQAGRRRCARRTQEWPGIRVEWVGGRDTPA